MKKFSFILASIFSLSSLHAAIVVDYDYAEGYVSAYTALGGSGSSATVADFSGDGLNDYVRHHTFSAPSANNYFTSGGGTQPGYDFDIYTAIANIRTGGFPPGPGSVSYFESAITGGSSIRIRPFTAGTGSPGNATETMSTATWLQFTDNSWGPYRQGYFDATSSLSIDGGNHGNQLFRFLVLADGNYYLSAASDLSGSLDFTLTGLDTATFYTYGNALDGSTILFNQASETAVLGSTLTNITAVGFYSEKVNFDGTAIAQNQDLSFDMTNFRADLSAGLVIPEPSTMALVGLALASLFTRRRRRKMQRCVSWQ